MKESFSLVVTQKSAKLTGKDMVMEGNQEVLVELKSCGKLDHNLPHTVQELCENWGRLTDITSQVTTPARLRTADTELVNPFWKLCINGQYECL